MRIGRLAELTGTSRRLLRYYERVGLLSADRESNGYRDYAESSVVRVRQIRVLLASGLPTALIKRMLPCAGTNGSLRPCPGVLDELRDRLAQLDRRSDELDRARRRLKAAIETTQRAR